MMAEIGLVRFARLALGVSESVLPVQRTKFSKRLFTQPHLLALLCPMRYEDWTFREAEVRLSEHAELRSVLKLNSAPDYTTLYRFLARLSEQDVAQAAVSSHFIRWVEHFGQPQRSGKDWLRWLALVDVERQMIMAQSARQAPWNDCATLSVLVAQAHRHTPAGCALADAEFDSERNRTFCRKQLKGNSVIPAKRRSSCRASGVRLEMREHSPSRQYALRSLIESVFSAVERKLPPRPWQNLPYAIPPGAAV